MEKTKKKIKIIRNHFFALLIVLTAVFLLAFSAQAASIYTYPSTGTHQLGSSFSLTVNVSSPQETINAISGTVSFPNDKLEVTSVSKNGSIINLWPQEPGFSNSNGTVNFEGIILNPGYTGEAGKILTVNFKTKAVGVANIKLSSGSVLANDGQGTNVLDGLGSTSMSIEVPITGPAASESTNSPITVGTLPAPQIKSSTHPNPDVWYNINQPNFSWDLPAGTNGARLLVSEKPQITPTVNYIPAISEKTLDVLEDGIWYFHVQLRNSAGWGGITHFRFQIDTKNPDKFIIEPQLEDDLTNPSRRFLLKAEDSGSGIAYFEIQIDDSELMKWQDDGSHIYQTAALKPGRHTLIIRAIDQAGNYISNFSDFIIKPLDRVVINNYPQQLASNKPLIVKGSSYPNSQVIISLQRSVVTPKIYNLKTDNQGNFTFVADEKLQDGVYKLWAEAVDSRGAYSDQSQVLTILVEPTKFLKFGYLAVNTLSVLIPIMALIFSTIILILFSLRKLRIIKKRLIEDVDDAHYALQKELKFLKKHLNEHSRTISKFRDSKRLTKSEKEGMDNFCEKIVDSITRIDQEISNVKKDIK